MIPTRRGLKDGSINPDDYYSLLDCLDVELALKLSRYVHNNCKDVPHDIGLKLMEIINNHNQQEAEG